MLRFIHGPPKSHGDGETSTWHCESLLLLSTVLIYVFHITFDRGLKVRRFCSPQFMVTKRRFSTDYWKVLWKHGQSCLFSLPKSSFGEHKIHIESKHMHGPKQSVWFVQPFLRLGDMRLHIAHRRKKGVKYTWKCRKDKQIDSNKINFVAIYLFVFSTFSHRVYGPQTKILERGKICGYAFCKQCSSLLAQIEHLGVWKVPTNALPTYF